MLLSDEQKKHVVTGRMARVTGKAIKLGGSKFGLYAAAVNENWNGKLPERENWILMENVFSNKPSALEFYVEDIAPGFYVFILETSLSAGGKELKNSVIVQSDAVQVVASE